jgi:hypothetical protein
MKQDAVAIVSDLLQELATELDLHYEDDDFSALKPTIDKMRPAEEFLKLQGAEVPSAVTHVFQRFDRKWN